MTALCQCGCKTKIPTVGGQRYVNSRHRQKAYRARVRKAMTAAGLPANPSLSAIEVNGGDGGRNGDAPRPRKRAQRRRTELRVSYRKAVDVVTAYIDRTEHLFDSGRVAENVLREALSPRAVAQLEDQQQQREAA